MEQKKRFEFLIENSQDCFGIIDAEGTVLYSTSAVKKICGYDPEEIEGTNIFDYLEDKEKSDLMKMFQAVLMDPKKPVQAEIAAKTKFGKTVYLDIRLDNHLSEPSIEGIVISWRDITEKKVMQKVAEYIANHDRLTRLPNIHAFNKQIEIQLKRAREKHKSFALMILRVRGLKYINDALGYKTGDKIIIEAANRLRSFLGDDRFICHYDGNQFGIIVRDLSSMEQYEAAAKNIIALYSIPFKIDLYELNVNIFMGISIFPEDGQDMNSLKRHANSALLRAKIGRKNRYEFYSPNMNIQSYKQFELRNDLSKAIEDNQLIVYYQPQFNIKTHQILAAEALIRWQHPKWGLVSPKEFIPIAEETGFVIEVENWILREVCASYRKWLKDGATAIKISVNFSSIHFLENNFVENIMDVIEEYELDSRFLIIEVTESIFAENKEQIISNIHRLRAHGIQVALDDFGKGYSSLQYLNQFNIDILKIDSSFIKKALLDKTSDVITKTVINMAKELNIKLVAEGIETEAQLAYLHKLDCHTGQGYLFSKPVPSQKFEKLLAEKEFKLGRFEEYEKVHKKERRKFFRINLTHPLESDMTVLLIDGERLNLGYTKVLINNIGPGGLNFVSQIRVPIKNDMVLQFKTKLLEEEIKIDGQLIWKEEMQEGLYKYGIEFIIDDSERTALTKVLKQFQMKVRCKMDTYDGRFVFDSAGSYFKQVFNNS